MRRLGVETDEAHLRRVILHPRVLRRGAGDLVDQAILDALVVFAGHRSDASLEQAGVGKGARIVAGGKAADDARQRVEGIGVERMRHVGHPPVLELLHGLADLHAEIDAADALVALLDAGGLAEDQNLEPDAPDTGRLNGQAAGFAGNAAIRLVAADHRIQCSVSAELLVDDEVDHDVALGLEAGGEQAFHRHDMGGDAALHVGGATAVDAPVLDLAAPGVLAPPFLPADRYHVDVAVQQKRTPAPGALQGGDDIGTPLVSDVDRTVSRVFLELFPVGLPLVDFEAEVSKVIPHEVLNRPFLPGDAGDGDDFLQELDHVIALFVDRIQESLLFIRRHLRQSFPGHPEAVADCIQRQASRKAPLPAFTPPAGAWG